MKSIRCMLGRHTGQENGGTCCFTCPRCGENCWQTRDFSHVSRRADEMIYAGRIDEALDYVKDEVSK